MKKAINSIVLILLLFLPRSRISAFDEIIIEGYAEEEARLEAAVDEYIQPFLDAGGFSGAILMARAGIILLSKGYGLANYELDVPNTPQIKFHIASISKTFTAAAIMILEERGKLNLHDLLAKFIPDYPGADKISIHHLLTHSSGIPNVNDFPDYEEKSRFPHTLEEIISWFQNKPLEFNPGAKYSYSNSNYNLLAYIIEKTSGRSYGDFLKENIFEPLGMENSGHDGFAGKLLSNRASGYVPAGAKGIANAPYLDWSIKTGNGSLYSTVEDLYKWDRALYTDKILKKATLEKIFAEHLKGTGYGWFIGKHLDRKTIYYNGRSPGFSSYLIRFVENDACVIILSNNYAPVTHLMVKDLAAILFGEKYEVPARIKPVKLEAGILDSLAGSFQFGEDFYRPMASITIEREGDHLVMKWSKTYSSSLMALSADEFLDRLFWARIIFQKNEKGKVTGFIWRDTADYIAHRINK